MDEAKKKYLKYEGYLQYDFIFSEKMITCNIRKEISGLCGWGKAEGIGCQRELTTSGGGCVHYLGCCDGFTGKYTWDILGKPTL